MATNKFTLDEEDYSEPYTLIGIHCGEEEYKLAFLLNQKLNMRLKRKTSDLDLSHHGLMISFPLYDFEDKSNYTHYYLVANKCRSQDASLQSSGGLFNEIESPRSNIHFLLPEFKKVDYFLTIFSDYETEPIREIVGELMEIKQIVSAYEIDPESIKSKSNLIFD